MAADPAMSPPDPSTLRPSPSPAGEPPGGDTLNLAELFLDRRLREGRGDDPALYVAPDDEAYALTWTYAEVASLADRFARAFLKLGVRPEERILLALPDGADFVGALFGALKIGAVGVMLNPHLKESEIAALYAYSRASLAVVSASVEASFRAADEASAGGAGSRHRWPSRFLVVGSAGEPAADRGDERWHRWDEISAGLGDAPVEIFPSHPDDPALWLFSGGTTGRPKAVVQSHGAFENTTRLYAQATLAYGPRDVTLSVPKLYFGYATGSNLFFPFSVGGTAILFPERPTAARLFDRIRRHRPTILIHVPTMVQQMLGEPGAAGEDLSCLRFATSAGEALPVALYERWKKTFGVELLDGLGTAEMWHVFVTNRPGDVQPGTLGRVVEGFEIQVCDDQGAPVPDGEVGRLWVRGDSRAECYWQNARRSAEAFRGEWFVGGDLVSRDADGYVTYCGRGDDMMKVSGKWVAPREVEGCLIRHPLVEECAVVGVETPEGLLKPQAFVVAVPGASPEDLATLEDTLKTWTLEHLQPHKHPRRITLLEAMPRTHLGKIDRGALKRRAAGTDDPSSGESSG